MGTALRAAVVGSGDWTVFSRLVVYTDFQGGWGACSRVMNRDETDPFVV